MPTSPIQLKYQKRDRPLNATIRAKASELLFEALNALGIQAALIGRSAVSLLDPSHPYAPKQLDLLVDHPSLTARQLAEMVVGHDPGHFSYTAGKRGKVVNVFNFRASEVEEIAQRSCRIRPVFVRDVGRNFCFDLGRCRIIGGVPVVPMPYVLLMQLDDWGQDQASEGKKDALTVSVTFFVKSPEWKEFNAALEYFPDANEQLGRLEAEIPDLKKRLKNLRQSTKISSQPVGGDSGGADVHVDHPVLTGNVVAPVIPNSPIPSTPELPQCSSPETSLWTSAVASAEPGIGSHDYTTTLTAIAWDVVHTLRDLGFRCALFGSMACQLYGNTRLPEDLDVLVLPPPGTIVDQETVKKELVNRNNQFFMKRSKDPEATYRVLFHRVSPTAVLPPNFTTRECKVDVLLPGTMSLPYLSEGEVNEVDGLPVVPALVLLLQKLQGWDDHLRCVETHKYRKHVVDAEDVKELLGGVGEMPVRMFRPWSEKEAMGEEFVRASGERVERFSRRFPETMECWKALGFQIS
ncbi:hypothetical protein FA15DRAFT_675153 [Coprinopsis marcescibilis]|uniref:Uncharacterized protein n=1 Tax=Coprinopsis marcescibilis TaxID=230819 RepID=A0A5C3KF69_COPMA|nr:hypothetical protein FA15DRAFT_675153 [Coprinopsis marcescibilis]